jgi:two-component system KDP operon response regulator KdpE
VSSAAKILVVEDEESLARMLRSSLIQAGYAVTSARTGREAMEELRSQQFGVVLLDLGLPDVDGKEVIAAVREHSHIPLVVISARDSGREKIAALDLGANDYVAKPFDMGELLARIRVALRPSAPMSGPLPTKATGLVLDLRSRRAIIDGVSVRLSQKEAELLHLLAEANGQSVSHEKICEAIWGRGASDPMNVRVLAWQVRRKIEPDPGAPRFLIAETGEGYRLNMD